MPNSLSTRFFAILTATIVATLLFAVFFVYSPIQAAGVIYVDANVSGGSDNGTSWANAYDDLQTALGSATAGDEIWVATGVYTPGATVSDTFQLINDVAIYGGFAATETMRSERDWDANVTVLSGDIDGDDTVDGNGVVITHTHVAGDNNHNVVVGSGVTTTAVLDGFTVTAGQANGDYPKNVGGGLYSDNSSPTLTHLTFSGNSADTGGGGIFNSNSNPTLKNVTISGNYSDNGGGGMFNYDNSNPTLINVIIRDNFAGFGGGMTNFSNSNPNLTNVTFSDHDVPGAGGGMFNSDGSAPLLSNVTFSNNSADDLGGGCTLRPVTVQF